MADKTYLVYGWPTENETQRVFNYLLRKKVHYIFINAEYEVNQRELYRLGITDLPVVVECETHKVIGNFNDCITHFERNDNG